MTFGHFSSLFFAASANQLIAGPPMFGLISSIEDAQIEGQTSRTCRSWLAESRFTCKYTQKAKDAMGPATRAHRLIWVHPSSSPAGTGLKGACLGICRRGARLRIVQFVMYPHDPGTAVQRELSHRGV